MHALSGLAAPGLRWNDSSRGSAGGTARLDGRAPSRAARAPRSARRCPDRLQRDGPRRRAPRDDADAAGRGRAASRRLGPGGKRRERQDAVHRQRLRQLPYVPAGGIDGHGGTGPRQAARAGEEGEPRDARAVHPAVDRRAGGVHRARLPERDAADVRAKALEAAARGPRRLPDEEPLILPPDFPRDVQVVATDLDRTLIWQDNVLRPRTLAALERAERAGIRVIVCTGRMVQSARRVLEPASSREPLV